MAVIIDNAILHILNNDGGESHLSEQELDIDSEACGEFISKHVKKMLDNTSAREACFNPESKVYEIIQSYKSGGIYFKEASKQICQHLSEVMSRSTEIPSADILVVKFRVKGDDYLAVLKLNYKECYTHQVGVVGSGPDNQIVKNKAVLPFDSGKVEEACVIPYDPMVIKVLEKPYMIDGAMVNYFSELFLECSAEISRKEAAAIIDEVSEEINQKFFSGGIDSAARIKQALLDEAETGEGVLRLENVASKAFEDNDEIKDEYIALVREAGIRQDLYMGEKFVKQQFGVQKFKADNGVEIKFPAELANDPDTVEIKYNPDGSVSVTLKNLRKSQ